MRRNTPVQIEKKIDEVCAKITKHIGNSTFDSVSSKGLAFEGYWGGTADTRFEYVDYNGSSVAEKALEQ